MDRYRLLDLLDQYLRSCSNIQLQRHDSQIFKVLDSLQFASCRDSFVSSLDDRLDEFQTETR